jgi:hypothetical protein
MDFRETANIVIDEAVSDLELILSSSGWTDLGVKDEVTGYQKTDKDRILVKGEGIIKATPEKIADYLWDINNTKAYFEDLESLKVLYDYNDLKIIHEVMKFPWPFSCREVLLALKKIKQDKDYLIIARSVDIGIQEGSDNVRANAFIRAYNLKSINTFELR